MTISPPSARRTGISPWEVRQDFDAYTSTMDDDQSPLLGHLVLYSVFAGRVTVDDMKWWFRDLNLDAAFLPAPIRPVDAFDTVTGSRGVRRTYSLGSASATLMIRHVTRDARQVVRHLVREVRDERETRLHYDAGLAECVFLRDKTRGAGPGAGILSIRSDREAIGHLSEVDRRQVYEVLEELEDSFRHHCVYLTADRLRSHIRSYIEALSAIRIHNTRGAYFVHREHARTVMALRALVSRMGDGSRLTPIPLADQQEMREMIITSFTTKAQNDLHKLGMDIALAQREHQSDSEIRKLHRRYQALRTATAEHSSLLRTTLDDTNAALDLVQHQLRVLLTPTT
ncbi:hypothetical protein GCM10009733_008070 [Nonomuraea maheshkhaliensis]|uniref:Uncharacterized protein n=1 Tax=Nonomuraea maheshkhaliensis TaxID=419590 RepID=A0ABN2ERL5_9ACTN